MAKHKLTTLKPRLAMAPSPLMALRQPAQRDGGRPWRRMRERVLRAAGGLCKCDECKQLGRVLFANEVHHIVPLHLGGRELDENNLLAVNADCHKRLTAQEAKAGKGRGE